MPLISGVGTVAGLGKESTYGTAVSRTRWVALNGTTLTQTARQRTARGALGKPKGFVASRFVTANEVGGTLTVPASYSGLGLLLEATLGAVSGTGPYTFAAGEVAAIPALTIEQIVGNSGKSEVYAGCKVNTATLSVSPGGEVTWAFDLIGSTKATANTAGSSSVGTPVAVEAFEAAVTYDGSAVDLKRDLTITINNALSRRQRVGSLNTAEPTVEGNRECTVVMPVDKQAFANRVTELADGAADLVITLTDTATGAKTIVITVSCQLKSDEQIGTSMGVLADGLTFESVGLPTIVVTNGESTYDV
jgi:hypothetical protein